MTPIRIFVASSEELKDERTYIGALVGKLEQLFADEGYSLELLVWEDFDSAYNNKRKQDEYNEKIRTADIFFGLFWTKAGEFTVEEFNVAMAKSKADSMPVNVFLKSPGEGINCQPSLKKFVTEDLECAGVRPKIFSNQNELKELFVSTILEYWPLKLSALHKDGNALRLGKIKIATIS